MSATHTAPELLQLRALCAWLRDISGRMLRFEPVTQDELHDLHDFEQRILTWIVDEAVATRARLDELDRPDFGTDELAQRRMTTP